MLHFNNTSYVVSENPFKMKAFLFDYKAELSRMVLEIKLVCQAPVVTVT